MMKLPKIILASGSPRRSEILHSVGWEFEKIIADIDESELENEDPVDYVLRLALAKAERVAITLNGDIVLGADTTVVIGKEIIGKPSDHDDARAMLRKLSGRTHDVLTGIAFVRNSGGEINSITGFERTSVNFSVLSEAEIDYLVEYGDPLDKAGAYAVQAQAALFIAGIKGDYWNVVGLPIHLVYQLAAKFCED